MSYYIIHILLKEYHMEENSCVKGRPKKNKTCFIYQEGYFFIRRLFKSTVMVYIQSSNK